MIGDEPHELLHEVLSYEDNKCNGKLLFMGEDNLAALKWVSVLVEGDEQRERFRVDLPSCAI